MLVVGLQLLSFGLKLKLKYCLVNKQDISHKLGAGGCRPTNEKHSQEVVAFSAF